jgi:hypothetical protein
MPLTMTPTPRLFVLAAAAMLLATAAPRATAQSVRPWLPATADSVQRLIVSAKLRFKEQQTDTLLPRDVQAFELVGQAARRLMRQLGRQNTLQAPMIEATLDSMGVDVDVVNDPALPSIVFVLVHHPDRAASHQVGYLLWYRGSELRMQGVSFPPSVRPRMRAWWTSDPRSPYAAVIGYERKGDPPQLGMRLLRMHPDGNLWALVQYEGNAPALGTPGELAFADVNRDGRPEIVTYTPADPDSFLTLAPGVPRLVQERVYTERPEGFVLHDARVVPGPVSTLRLFALTLMNQDREGARRLVVDPARVDEAFGHGWGSTRAADAWRVENGEAQPWPEWLGLRIQGDRGPRRWVFDFVIRDGRWVIRGWRPVQPARTAEPVRPGGIAPGGRED